jgi:CheY-like chemotaxis protein
MTTAQNGKDALEKAHLNPPDLIISDILMPVMDGYTLCKIWKADKQLKHIPFIFYTATYTELKDEEFALSLGADRFIIKPQESEVLMKIFIEVVAPDFEVKSVNGRP